MKAAWYKRFGAAREVLEVGEMADPEPGAGEVLVRLKTSGVNPSDVVFSDPMGLMSSITVSSIRLSVEEAF